MGNVQKQETGNQETGNGKKESGNGYPAMGRQQKIGQKLKRHSFDDDAQ